MPPSEKSTRWSMTIWMPPHTEEGVKEMIQKMQQVHPSWSLEGQLERGEKSGKLHYQLMLRTPDQPRHSAIRKIFPACDIQPARNASALENYVHKEETRVAEFKTVENKFIQWPLLRSTFFKWVVETQDIMAYCSDDDKLRLWDEFIGISIQEGMEVDIMGVNPQYRSCIMRYWNNYVIREAQTSRHTSVDKIGQTDIQEVTLPILT